MNPRIYHGSLDLFAIAQILERSLSGAGLIVQKIGTAEFLYVQVRRDPKGRGGFHLSTPEPAFTVRIEKQRGDTVVSIGQSKWAEKPSLRAVNFYPLVSGQPSWFEEYRLVERVLGLLDEYVQRLQGPITTSSSSSSAPPPRTSPSELSTARGVRPWDLGAVQSAMTSALSRVGFVDIPALAKQSNNSESIVIWMAEKMAASGNSYVLTLDKKKILSKERVKEMIQSKLNSAPQAGGKNFCPKCGKPVFAGDRFCKSCGASLS